MAADFDTDPPEAVLRRRANRGGWLRMMSAVFVGTFLSGLLLCVIIRIYTEIAVRNAVDQMRDEFKASFSPPKKDR